MKRGESAYEPSVFRRCTPWTPEREADFIRCWNEGMPLERLLARFGWHSRAAAADRASELRRAGKPLAYRQRGPSL